jgi:hypothetical protein
MADTIACGRRLSHKRYVFVKKFLFT